MQPNQLVFYKNKGSEVVQVDSEEIEQIFIFDEENFLILDKEKQIIKYDQSGNQTAKFMWK